MARRGLGRGLDALISRRPATVTPDAPAAAAAGTAAAQSGLVELNVASIDPSPWQPRQSVDEERLQDLTDSIREQGLVQPVVVRRKGERYELVAGERRWRAVQRLDWETIPAVLMEATDARMRELALVENLQRDDLNSIEVAVAYQALQAEHGLTHEQIGARLGVSRAQITNTLRLLDLPEEIKGFVSSGALSAGHARALLTLPDALSQIRLARRIMKNSLSVREVERLVKGRSRASGHAKTADKAPARDPQIRDLEDRLRQHLGTKVSIVDRDGQGVIHIEYYSREDVARLLECLGLPDELA